MEVLPVPTETVEQKVEVTSLSQLREIIATLNVQSTLFKNMSLQVKNIVKDVEKQSKELEKVRNRKSRTKIQRKEGACQSGITKPVAISDDLAKFLGVAPGTLVPRNEVTKGVSEYVRKYELSDPTNKQKFLLESKPEGLALKELLGNPVDGVTYFNLQRYLKPHYLSVKSDPELSDSSKQNDQVVEESSEGGVTEALTEEKKLKKKIILKKKKVSLTEEA